MLPAIEAGWRVTRTYSPASEIEARLDLDDADTEDKFLVVGTRGSGKSTEIHSIAEARARRDFVVLVDLERHFEDVVHQSSALQKVAVWELCFLAALAVMRAAKERLGIDFDADVEGDLKRAWSSAAGKSGVNTPADFNLATLGSAMVVFASELTAPGAGTLAAAALKALEKGVGGASWKLPFGLSSMVIPDQDEALEGMLAVANRILGIVQTQHRRVLLVLDGLDRITDRAKARELFVESSALSRLECRQVIGAPFALRHAMELAEVRRYLPFVLVNEPVIDRNDPTREGPGVDVMVKLFRQRVADLQGTFFSNPALLRRLAYYSGGRARDFVKLVRRAATRAAIDKASVINDAIVDATLRELRLELETGLNQGHYSVFEAVALDPAHQLPRDPVELVWDLVDHDRLLPYPNDSEWYFPHTLFTLRAGLRWRPGQSG